MKRMGTMLLAMSALGITVCGGEPLCPYCIGSREHDCVRSGEVDG